MSVEKFIVTSETTNYTSLPNKVLQNLKNPEALGVWCYCISMPSSWEFHKENIQSHFGIGRDKLLKIFTLLKKHNLIKIQSIKNNKGRIEKWFLHIKNGEEFLQNTEIQECGKTTILKNQALENQALENSTYKRNIDKDNKEQRKHKSSYSLKLQKEENKKKHDWAAMKNEKANIEKSNQHKIAPMSPEVKAIWDAAKKKVSS